MMHIRGAKAPTTKQKLPVQKGGGVSSAVPVSQNSLPVPPFYAGVQPSIV